MTHRRMLVLALLLFAVPVLRAGIVCPVGTYYDANAGLCIPNKHKVTIMKKSGVAITLGNTQGSVTALTAATGVQLKCPPTCTFDADHGSVVDFRAVPNPNLLQFLSEWAGACAGKPNPCQLTIQEDTTVMVAFPKTEHLYTGATAAGPYGPFPYVPKPGDLLAIAAGTSPSVYTFLRVDSSCGAGMPGFGPFTLDTSVWQVTAVAQSHADSRYRVQLKSATRDAFIRRGLGNDGCSCGGMCTRPGSADETDYLEIDSMAFLRFYDSRLPDPGNGGWYCYPPGGSGCVQCAQGRHGMLAYYRIDPNG